jgi:hypothetical protein
MTREDLIQHLEKVANFCRGMALDPSIPSHVKEACKSRAASLDKIVSEALAPDDNDFPLGKACDLSGEGTCEACQ